MASNTAPNEDPKAATNFIATLPKVAVSAYVSDANPLALDPTTLLVAVPAVEALEVIGRNIDHVGLGGYGLPGASAAAVLAAKSATPISKIRDLVLVKHQPKTHGGDARSGNISRAKSRYESRLATRNAAVDLVTCRSTLPPNARVSADAKAHHAPGPYYSAMFTTSRASNYGVAFDGHLRRLVGAAQAGLRAGLAAGGNLSPTWSTLPLDVWGPTVVAFGVVDVLWSAAGGASSQSSFLPNGVTEDDVQTLVTRAWRAATAAAGILSHATAPRLDLTPALYSREADGRQAATWPRFWRALTARLHGGVSHNITVTLSAATGGSDLPVMEGAPDAAMAAGVEAKSTSVTAQLLPLAIKMARCRAEGFTPAGRVSRVPGGAGPATPPTDLRDVNGHLPPWEVAPDSVPSQAWVPNWVPGHPPRRIPSSKDLTLDIPVPVNGGGPTFSADQVGDSATTADCGRRVTARRPDVGGVYSKPIAFAAAVAAMTRAAFQEHSTANGGGCLPPSPMDDAETMVVWDATAAFYKAWVLTPGVADALSTNLAATDSQSRSRAGPPGDAHKLLAENISRILLEGFHFGCANFLPGYGLTPDAGCFSACPSATMRQELRGLLIAGPSTSSSILCRRMPGLERALRIANREVTRVRIQDEPRFASSVAAPFGGPDDPNSVVPTLALLPEPYQHAHRAAEALATTPAPPGGGAGAGGDGGGDGGGGGGDGGQSTPGPDAVLGAGSGTTSGAASGAASGTWWWW